MKIKNYNLVFRRLIPAGLALLVCTSQRSQAQVFPPQGDDTTPSMGVFQITVDPAFYPLVNAAGALVAYPGYNSGGGTLTSPLCVDGATTIGRSNPNSRFYLFPQPLGAGSWDVINGYGDYASIPTLWSSAASPTEEVLTEIKSFVLLSVTGSAVGQACPPDPRIPTVPLSWPMIKAGTFAGVSPRSLGMVQENVANGPPPPDFPARSFFDIFVEVNLPPIPGTVSGTAFPGTGAVLYNDSPLIITNLNLTSFPPQVVYIHGQTPAVPLKFRTSNPPYWSAGDIFGYLVLAGHGTITNDCNNTPAVQGLLNGALGPVGTPAAPLPVEWLRPTNLCPSPGSSYVSVNGTNFSGQSIDVLSFTIPGVGIVYARNFNHGNFPNPITPPTPGNTATYTAPNTVVLCDLSIDGQNFSPATAQGPLTTKITNTTVTGSTSTFDTEMLALNLNGNGPFGPFMLRESPTKQSLGKHTLRSDPRGYRISSFFDVFLELSLNGGVSWAPANRSIRVQASAPPAAPNSLYVTDATQTSVTLNWLGSFTLQGGTNVSGPYTDLTGAVPGPVVMTTSGSQKFFRLRQ